MGGRHRTLIAVLVMIAPATLAAPTAADPAPPPAPAPPTIDALLGRLAKSPGISADFVEKKRMALLKVPIETKGSIYFERPASMARHVKGPVKSRIVLSGNRLTIRDSNGVRRLDIRSNATLHALIEAFVLVLRGDRAGLDRRFHLTLHPTEGAGWRVVLRPKGASLRRILTEMSLEGRQLVISRMIVSEKNGDRTVTTFHRVDAKRRFSAKERKMLFGARAK